MTNIEVDSRQRVCRDINQSVAGNLKSSDRKIRQLNLQKYRKLKEEQLSLTKNMQETIKQLLPLLFPLFWTFFLTF
jgi:hypothetical protein